MVHCDRIDHAMEGYAKKVEINCDMGEGFGRWKMVGRGRVDSASRRGQLTCIQGPDDELIKLIDYANIACGFHAGDPSIMLKTIRLAKEHGVKIGAHPGLQGVCVVVA